MLWHYPRRWVSPLTDVVHAVDGTVEKVDTGTKTVVVKTADGTEHTFHYLGDVTVDGS